MDRTMFEAITFRHAFKLPGTAETFAAGTYEVETTERRIEALSYSGWQRLQTTIVPRIGSAGCRQVTTVDPVELAAALSADEAT